MIGEWITVAANVAQALALVAAVVTIVLGIRQLRLAEAQAKAERDLQLMLSLLESFRARWEGRWDLILDALGVDHRGPGLARLPKRHARELGYMLNWVDWLGTVLRTGVLSDPKPIFASLEVPIRRILNAGRPVLEADTRRHGSGYWASALFVAEHLHVDWAARLTRVPVDQRARGR